MKYYKRVPTWSPSKQWYYSTFYSKEEFREYIKGLFKEPGKYGFDNVSTMFNEHARTFNKKKMFCEAPEGSRDYQEFWDTEKEKCRKGVIFQNDKGGTWYLPRFYYHWLNFLQIYDKRPDVKKFVFPDVRDVQYHMALYEILAELFSKNSCILKSRQKASSYFHIAKLYNKYIFEQGYVGKIGASDKKYINKTKGTWKFLNQYHNFTNMHTAWACINSPDKEFEWEQKVETRTPDGKKVQVGTMATITGVTFDKDPVSAVGGATDEFFYEEGGIAPTADVTYGYIMEAMREGAIVTGHFTIAGSVGSLDQCKPLEKFIKDPIGNDFYPVNTTLLDDSGTPAVTGLFIPEQWGMFPYIDQYGNSMIAEALQYLNEEYERIKKEKGHEDYQLRVSQRPRNIHEALAIRTQSIFPVKHTSKQIKRIEDNQLYLQEVDLERTDTNEIKVKKAERSPMEYPSSRTAEDKRGCIVIHVHPGKDPAWGRFYASIDPVEVGATDSSDSLASIYVYMNPVEVTNIDENGSSTTYLEGGKLAAEWVGRYDDPDDTHEQVSLIMEYYNAWTILENNKTSFITYMKLKKRIKYLAPKTEMLFDKEIDVTQNSKTPYGWTKTPAMWKKLLEYGVNFLSEELGNSEDDTGKVNKVTYGVERIPFIWLLKEMQQYDPKKNFDRISAYCPLIAFAKIQEAAQGIKKRTIQPESTTNNKRIRTFDRQSFLKSIGKPDSKGITQRGLTFKTLGR